MFRQDIIAEFNQQRRITVNENQQADYLYLECHVTFEPVFGDDLARLSGIAERNGFKVADLLMQKRLTDTAERSKRREMARRPSSSSPWGTESRLRTNWVSSFIFSGVGKANFASERSRRDLGWDMAIVSLDRQHWV